jgi:cysteine synthase A
VEPQDSAVISGGSGGPHKIQGIGAGFIPKNLNIDLIDEILTIRNEDAYKYARLCAEKEGILAGISSGAVLAAAASIIKKKDDLRVLVFNYDTGERYLSVPELFD